MSVTLTVALGDQHYRVERPFFANPGLGVISDVAVDWEGNLHVLVRNDSLVSPGEVALTSLTPEGGVLANWGEGDIVDAHMLCASLDGRLLVVDRDAHEVVIFRDRVRVGGIGRRNRPMHPFNHPTGVAVAPDGTIYVSDGYANHRVHRFSVEGELIGSWGELGSEPGQFMNPHAVWVQPDGTVIVVDRENDRLQVFTAEGKLLDIWQGFVKPLDLWGDADGRLYVADFVPSLTLLSPAGERLGRCRPVLNAAHGISGDRNGNLYLAEPSPSRVTRLVPIPSPQD